MTNEVQQKSEQIADLLLRAEMTDDERAGWIEAVAKMNKEQLEEFIQTFENELRDIEVLRAETRDKLKVEIENMIKDKY